MATVSVIFTYKANEPQDECGGYISLKKMKIKKEC